MLIMHIQSAKYHKIEDLQILYWSRTQVLKMRLGSSIIKEQLHQFLRTYLVVTAFNYYIYYNIYIV